MKLLILARHAKSEWGDATLADFDRSLNERGKRDAPRMARYLQKSGIIPQRIVSSPAKRARKTAKILAEGVGYDVSTISYVSDIYDASTDTLMKVIQDFDNRIERYMLVGHNPGMTNLANLLIHNSTDAIEHVPTSGIVVLRLDVANWQAIEAHRASLAGFITPADVPA
ncbi:MAG: histidine phosphatase family protein [Gammaproteobacteria bacterium]|jgi:phosphohistidine phosphatase|nr:histidine phosphatase family protein [Gammaproteobacteria bacterium]